MTKLYQLYQLEDKTLGIEMLMKIMKLKAVVNSLNSRRITQIVILIMPRNRHLSITNLRVRRQPTALCFLRRSCSSHLQRCHQLTRNRICQHFYDHLIIKIIEIIMIFLIMKTLKKTVIRILLKTKDQVQSETKR